MEFARQEYFWLLLAIPLVAALWGIGVWHRRRMRIRFGNIENLEVDFQNFQLRSGLDPRCAVREPAWS